MGVVEFATPRPINFIALFINMFNLIITSKDRPAQLFALGESIQKNAPFFKTTVLYTYSDYNYRDGYDVCWGEDLFDRVILERDFRSDLLGALDGEYITFATDDGIFFRDCGKPDQYKQLLNLNDVVCVSLRLGENTPLNNYYTPNYGCVRFNKVDNFVFWNHKISGGNFAYPLSVDAHIYKAELIKLLLNETPFHNPNSLEGNLQRWNNQLPPMMVAPKESCYVGNSINRVQNFAKNYAGGVHGVSPEDLNRKFLEGARIDWERFPYSDIRSPHHEFEVVWK